MEMNKENNTPFKAEDVNWDELAAIGILKDELEMGVDVVMDATLQLVRKDGDPLLEILGIKPVEQ